MVGAAMLLLTYGAPLGEALAQRAGFGTVSVRAWQIGQWPVIFVFVLLAFDLLYHYAPSRSHPRWQWIEPGTMIAIAAQCAGRAREAARNRGRHALKPAP